MQKAGGTPPNHLGLMLEINTTWMFAPHFFQILGQCRCKHLLKSILILQLISLLVISLTKVQHSGIILLDTLGILNLSAKSAVLANLLLLLLLYWTPGNPLISYSCIYKCIHKYRHK